MAELVAHKVQVCLAAAAQREQPDHLMQGDCPVNDGRVADFVHIRVHGGIRQTEHHGLVAHQRLIVALHIGHCVLSGTAQAHVAPHPAQVPVLVTDVPHRFDPHIRQTHAQPVVKANAAVLNGQAHAGHTGHILRNGDCIGLGLMHQLVGKLEVGDRLHIRIQGEVPVVIGEVRAQRMVMVEHGGHAIKAEAVEVVLVQPEFQVGEQEVDDLILAVVEALGIPCQMVAPLPLVEELVLGAIEHVDAFRGVFGGVGMHHIQQHPQPHPVGLVHQILQILRFSEPA